MFELAYPLFLWGLFLIPLYIFYELIIKEKKRPKINYNRFDILKEITSHSSLLRFIPIILRSLLLAALVIAIARPRLTHKEELIRGKGIDIMLSIDVSGSMKALDFKPDNRLEAAKSVAMDFIEGRKNDRIGVVEFASHAFTICPLTTDYSLLSHIVSNIDFPQDDSGTAIGMGIATSVARMLDSQTENKIIILITDGANNTGEIDPITAAQLAATNNIKIYPVGIGSHGLVDFPFQHPRYGTQYRKVEIEYDMDSLHQIAQITGVSQAWEATNTEEFRQVIKEIDSLEPSEYEVEHYYKYNELFHWLLLVSVLLLAIEILYRTILRIEII